MRTIFHKYGKFLKKRDRSLAFSKWEFQWEEIEEFFKIAENLKVGTVIIRGVSLSHNQMLYLRVWMKKVGKH